MHNNFTRAGYRGLSFKYALWRAAQASTEGEFKHAMEKMKELSVGAASWFNDKHPVHWSKSHFSESSKCDMLLNNACETFNMCILEAREEPILTMLEWIRKYLVERLQKNRDVAKKWRGRLCPRIKQILQRHWDKVGDCMTLKCDVNKYEVSTYAGEQLYVNLDDWFCSCRCWGLSGIPCMHACAAIHCEKGVVEDFVDPCYTVEVYKQVYEHAMLGINGRMLWDKTMFIPPMPPNFGRGKGRPERARRVEHDEPSSKGKKALTVKRQQTTVKCGKCGIDGHNARACGKRPLEASVRNRRAGNGEGGSSNIGASVRNERAGNGEGGSSNIGASVRNKRAGNGEGGSSKKFKPPRPAKKCKLAKLAMLPPTTTDQSQSGLDDDVLHPVPTQMSQIGGHKALTVGPSAFEQLQLGNPTINGPLSTEGRQKFKDLSCITSDLSNKTVILGSIYVDI